MLGLSFQALSGQSLWVKGYAGLGRAPFYHLRKSLDLDNIYIENRSPGYGLLMPAIAIQNRKRNIFFEISVDWQKSNRGDVSATVRMPPSDSLQFVNLGSVEHKYFDLQIEFNHKILENKTSRWKPYLGFALNPSWGSYDFQSKIGQVFSKEVSRVGANLGVIPRLQFQWTENWSLDFNAAIFLFSINYESSALRNPLLNSNQQTNSLFEFDFLSKNLIRVGVSYKLFGTNIKTD